MDLYPRELIDFGNVKLLIAKMMKLTITNNHPNENFIIYDLLSQTCEVVFFFEDHVNFPYILKPKASLTVRVVFVPEMVGNFESLIYWVIENP